MALPLENWVCGASGEPSPWKQDGTGVESRCGERVVDGAQRRAWGSEGVFASAGCCTEGFVLQGGGDSVVKGFWMTLFPCPPSPQPSLP